MIEGLDKGESVADSWQENIAAWFIRLWLNGKLDVITLVFDIRAKDVETLAITL